MGGGIQSREETYAEAIAGAVANVLRERFPPVPSSSVSASLPTNPNLQDTPRTSFNLASELRSTAKRPKFSPPSLFEGLRSRRKKGKSAQPSKTVHYMRDVVLLPLEFKSRSGEISFPRGSRRTQLGKAGLVGKVELDSSMSDMQVRQEICEVFATPMGMSQDDIKENRFFSFSYLQRAGSGSRSLCLPSVKDDFQWNGRQVASLAKSGAFIYILAEEELPGYNKMVSTTFKLCVFPCKSMYYISNVLTPLFHLTLYFISHR